jgi:NAD(P)-dependent dehydrogenase (short-subunit alcohol dehydrogenase family)
MSAFEGKVVFVTGAGTGIGQAIARQFAAAGAKVLIGARREGPLRETCAYAPEAISWVKMDLTNQRDRVRALEAAMERHGRLDVLVNNAGNQLCKPFLDQTEDEIDACIDTNLISTAKLILRAVPLLKVTRGNIVNISSTAGRFAPMPSAGLTTYSATRGGMNQLTRTLATELGPIGIRINAVAPGLTFGEVAKEMLLNDESRLDGLKAITPLGRIGQPDDIARSVLFLAGDEWLTGQVLDSSGGWWIGGG